MTQPVWEERWHPLRREWVILAGHRAARPWSGEAVPLGTDAPPAHDPDCRFCPGNRRVSGKANPDYAGPWSFVNDHPPWGPGAPDPDAAAGPYATRPARGLCKVINYTGRHDLSLAEMPVADIALVAAAWRRESIALAARPEVKSVLVFENRGKVVGVSNPHPHGQIYGANLVFAVLEREVDAVAAWRTDHGENLFDAMLAFERHDGRRLLEENAHFAAFVPFAARHAYETTILARGPARRLADLDAAGLEGLARTLKNVLVRYDNLWRAPFPYVLVVHQAPVDGGEYPDFRLHLEIYPPYRAPGTLKYLAGPELGGGNLINPSSPEAKAAELRRQPGVHYKERP